MTHKLQIATLQWEEGPFLFPELLWSLAHVVHLPALGFVHTEVHSLSHCSLCLEHTPLQACWQSHVCPETLQAIAAFTEHLSEGINTYPSGHLVKTHLVAVHVGILHGKLLVNQGS